MDAAPDDEKKPFESERENVREFEPDPEEYMNIQGDPNNVWVVKIPKYLLDRWHAVKEQNVHLATLKIYEQAVNPATGKSPRIILTLPPESVDAADEPTWYELDMVHQRVQGQVVISEQLKVGAPPSSRARSTTLVGSVRHECHVRPRLGAAYRAKVRERVRAANTPVRQTRRFEEEAGQGSINRMAAGVLPGRVGAGVFNPTKQKPVKGSFERFARMPRNQLMDSLFSLFKEKEFWPIRLLRQRTEQPEQYLKEVLTEIATLHRSGEHSGTYELQAVFRDQSAKDEALQAALVKGETAGEFMDDGFEGNDEEDMEEVGMNEEGNDEDDDDMEEV